MFGIENYSESLFLPQNAFPSCIQYNLQHLRDKVKVLNNSEKVIIQHLTIY